jgi:hypothetical protein
MAGKRAKSALRYNISNINYILPIVSETRLLAFLLQKMAPTRNPEIHHLHGLQRNWDNIKLKEVARQQ